MKKNVVEYKSKVNKVIALRRKARIYMRADYFERMTGKSIDEDKQRFNYELRCDCSQCHFQECKHRDCMRRLPEELHGLGLCSRLQENYSLYQFDFSYIHDGEECGFSEFVCADTLENAILNVRCSYMVNRIFDKYFSMVQRFDVE